MNVMQETHSWFLLLSMIKNQADFLVLWDHPCVRVLLCCVVTRVAAGWQMSLHGVSHIYCSHGPPLFTVSIAPAALSAQKATLLVIFTAY